MYKGEYSLGTVKETPKQIKKHFSQMTQDELNHLTAMVRGFDAKKLKKSGHVIEKASVSFDESRLGEMLNNCDIIEYNKTFVPRLDRYEGRILIRDRESQDILFFNKKTGEEFKAKANLCLVISFSQRIVTAYWNKESDNHRSMDWSRYDESLSILN